MTRELQPCDRFEWEKIVRRCQFRHLRRAAARDLKVVALVLATFGDGHGEDVRPGVPRLARVCLMGESTVRRYVDALLELGLLERVANGGGRGVNGRPTAARYRLTTPSDLLEWVDLLDPDDGTPLSHGERSSPVDNPATPLMQGERSSDQGGPATPLTSEATPLTSASNSAHPWVSAYQPLTNHLDHPQSSEPGTSPARCAHGRPIGIDGSSSCPTCLKLDDEVPA